MATTPRIDNLETLTQEATEDNVGVTTSFAPVVKSSVHTVSSANYTILDADGFSTVLVSTGASDRTITLPTAADNAGRILTIKKTDAGAGYLLVDGEGSETIDGALTAYLPSQYDYITVACDGISYHLVDSFFNPLVLSNQSTAASIANAIYVDFGTGTITVPPGKYLISILGTSQSYFNPQPTWATTALRLSPLVDGFVADDDGNNIFAGEGAAQGQTGGGGNLWGVDIIATDFIKTISTTITFKLQGYYRNVGGTEVGGLGRSLQRGKVICKKIGL